MDSGQPFAASGMTAEIFQQRPSRMSCAGGDSASIKHLPGLCGRIDDPQFVTEFNLLFH
jgi:hypothetical protein